MRVWRKAASGALVLGAIWMALEIRLCGGFTAYLSCDSHGQAMAERLRRFKFLDPAPDRRLVYLGDSNCDAQEAGGQVPRLRELLDQGVRAGRLGPGWTFEAECGAGHNAFDFERQAAELVASGPVPRAVLIPVSLRSLNALGSNGFFRNRRGEGLWDRPGFLEAAWKFPVAFVRAGWIWNVRFLAEFFGHDDFYPYPVPHPTGHLPPARPISPAVSGAHAAGPDKDLQFQVIYGQGYRLNPALLNALLQTGWRLQEAGAEVFFVVSPATMDELQRRWGPEIRGQVDAGDQALVRQLGDRGLRALDLHAEDQRAFYESPAEHLDGAGRRAVAERLLRWMADALDQAGAGARR